MIGSGDDFTAQDLGVDEDGSIVDRFERKVDQYYDSIALESAGRKLTYSELDRNANHIARILLEKCLDDAPVALMFQDDLLAVSGIFGVLKAGKKFVFLNPAFPPERISAIVEDVKPGLVLTEAGYLETLSNLFQLPVENLSGFDFSGDVERLHLEISPHAPAYIIYTSGSTGMPKGVLFTHRMVLYDNFYVIRDAGITSDDRFGMLTALSFVASRAGLYGALLSGATLCMHNVSNSRPEAIAAWLDEAQISILYTTPSLYKNIFSSIHQNHIFRSLRTIHLGGEKVTAHEVQLFREHCTKQSLLLVIYGQTETGRVARFAIRHDTLWEGEDVPAGYPLPGKEVILVGEDGQPVKAGDVGDIVVRSSYIPSGYFGGTDLARTGYMPDPSDARVYLFYTGDLGKLTEDGTLVYLGRKDNQVKVNGQRVELGEIEAALMQQKEIQSVSVSVRRVGNDERQIRLIAYVVAKPASRLTGSQLRERLSQVLPAYMIPSRFIFIPTMPLTAHGKIDLRSLPDPDHRPELTTVDLPRDKMEEDLVAIWKRVLNLETLGVLDDFFDLGGDSLMAMQLLFEIEKEFSQRMPLAVISNAYNIREQAELLRTDDIAKFASVLIPIRTDGNKQPVFCIGGKGGNPIRFHRLAQYLGEDRPVYFFRSRGFEPGEKIETSIESIAADYLREVKKIQPHGPYCFIGESGGGFAAYEMAQQLLRAEQEIALVVLLDTYTGGFNKKKRPRLIRRYRLWIKHLQTLSKGGASGIHAYIKYYAELRRYRRQELLEKQRVDHILAELGSMDSYQLVREANMQAGYNYQPKAYSGPVLLLSAVRQVALDGDEGDRGWGEIGIEELIVHPIDCYHGNILFEPFVRQVAGKINEHLDNMVMRREERRAAELTANERSL